MQAIAATEPELVKTLTEVGFMAAGHGLRTQAETIFSGLAYLRPDSEVPAIGQALALLQQGQYPQAQYLLREQALKIAPESGMALCFLGLALQLDGQRQAARHAWEQARSGADEQAAALARSLLNAA